MYLTAYIDFPLLQLCVGMQSYINLLVIEILSIAEQLWEKPYVTLHCWHVALF